MALRFELIGSLKEHIGCINSVKFDKTGVYCVTAGNDRSVRLWNPRRNLHIKRFFGPHNHRVNDVSLSDDNKNFVSVGSEHCAFYWDTLTGQILRKLNHGGGIGCCTFVANGSILCTGSEDNSVKLWDLRVRNPIQTLNEAKDTITGVCEEFSILYAASADGAVRLYDVRRGMLKCDFVGVPVVSLVPKIATGNNLNCRISVSKSIEDCYLVAGLDDCIRLLERGDILARYTGHKCNNYRISCAFDPSERFVVSGTATGDIVCWDVSDGESVCAISKNIHNGPITSIAFSTPEILNSNLKLRKDLNIKTAQFNQDYIFATVGQDSLLNIIKFQHNQI